MSAYRYDKVKPAEGAGRIAQAVGYKLDAQPVVQVQGLSKKLSNTNLEDKAAKSNNFITNRSPRNMREAMNRDY